MRMTFGGGDRIGKRENKNFDRRTKRGILAKANPFAKAESTAVVLTESPAAPTLVAARTKRSIIDCGSNLLSRQLEREHGRMLGRAQYEHVDACISFVTDAERLDELAALARAQPGFVYMAAGVHPDNIKRSHDKSSTSLLAKVRSLALTSECVAIYAGLDGTRDFASQFPQEKLLKEQLALAAEMHLPALLTVISAAERTAELVAEFNEAHATGSSAAETKAKKDKARKEAKDAAAAAAAGGAGAASSSSGAGGGDDDGKESKEKWTPRHAIVAFDGDAAQLAGYLAAGCYIMLDGALCDPASEPGERLRGLLPQLPLSRLLLAANAPLHTPQSISDHVIKSSRNEPSNLPAVLPIMVAAYNTVEPAALGRESPLTAEELAAITYDNAVAFFRLSEEHQSPSPGAGAAAAGGAGDADAADESAAGADGAKGKAGKGKGAGAGSKKAAAADGESGSSAAEGASGSAAVSSAASKTLSALASGLAPVSIDYRCRLCRWPLFSGDDVLPHDGRSIHPSSRTLANLRAEEEAEAAAALEVAAARNDRVAKAAAAAAAKGAKGGKGGKAAAPESDDDSDSDAGGRRRGKGKKGKGGAKDKDAGAAPAADAKAPKGGKKGKGRKGRRGGDSDSGADSDAAPAPAPVAAPAKGAKAAAPVATAAGRAVPAVAAGAAAGRAAAGAAGPAGRGALAAKRPAVSDDDEDDHDHSVDDGSVGASSGGADDGHDESDDEDHDEDEDDFDEDAIGDLPPLKGGKGKAGGDYKAPPPKPKFADGATVIDTGEGLSEVAVGRWHQSRGRAIRSHDDGVCRMFLIDRPLWADYVSSAEPEGALQCPGCRAKVGMYSLGGLKCSCGLAVAPAFKVPKAKVDAVLHGEGVDALSVALAAASMEERGGELGGLLSAARPGEVRAAAGDEDAAKGKEKRMTSMPVRKWRGNFPLFRNQDLTQKKPKEQREKEKHEKAAAAAAAGGAGAAALEGDDDDEDEHDDAEAAAGEERAAAVSAPGAAAEDGEDEEDDDEDGE